MPYPVASEPSRLRLVVNRIASTDDLERADLELQGEVDLGTAPELDEVLDRLCDAGYRVVVVDLAGVEFLGCVGLGSLIRIHHRLVYGGRRLVLTRPGPMICRMVRLSSMDDVLDLRESMPYRRRIA